MKIAIDLDNTLFHNKIVEDVIDELGLDPKLKSIYHWELDELGPEGKALCEKRFRDPKYMCNLKPILGNKKKIKEWAAAGHTLICVTARDFSIAKETLKMVNDHYPDIKKVILVGAWDKTHVYGGEKFDIVIDDSHNNTKQALSFRKTKKVFFITNKNTPYNWDFINELTKSKRVYKVGGIREINL